MTRVLNNLNVALLQGQSSIINVLAHVGPNQPNNPDDVKVVQQLIQLVAKGSEGVAAIGVPNVTGRFDASTGFWIYHAQYVHKKRGHTHQIIDGIVSPAHGTTYASGATWTIMAFNVLAWKADPRGYAEFFERWAASSMAATR